MTPSITAPPFQSPMPTPSRLPDAPPVLSRQRRGFFDWDCFWAERPSSAFWRETLKQSCLCPGASPVPDRSKKSRAAIVNVRHALSIGCALIRRSMFPKGDVHQAAREIDYPSWARIFHAQTYGIREVCGPNRGSPRCQPSCRLSRNSRIT